MFGKIFITQLRNCVMLVIYIAEKVDSCGPCNSERNRYRSARHASM